MFSGVSDGDGCKPPEEEEEPSSGEGWYASGIGTSCATRCKSEGLVCDSETWVSKFPAIDTEQEFAQQLITMGDVILAVAVVVRVASSLVAQRIPATCAAPAFCPSYNLAHHLYVGYQTAISLNVRPVHTIRNHTAAPMQT